MLLPKFTIRLLLLVMVGVAFFATVVTYALRGNPWMLGVAAGIGSLAVVTLVYVLLFGFFGVLAEVLPGKVKRELNQASGIRPPLPESPH